MGMTVNRRKDTGTTKVFVHKVADIRGGVSVVTSELGSDFLPEGAVLSEPKDGLCHVVKVAVLTAAVTTTGKDFKVKKGHQFKKGDIVLTAVNGKATAIASIDESNKDYDTITTDAALGVVAIGGFLCEAKAVAAENGAALKYEPFSVNGTGKPIEPKSNLNTDAWVIGVTKGNELPDFIASKLKGIINYN